MSSLKDKKSCRTDAVPTVTVGRLAAIAEDGTPMVEFSGSPAPLRAMATARFDAVPPGAAVALMFIDGDRARPLAIGVIEQDELSAAEERLTLSHAREIVLQCGRASIVLTRAGKVLVRGAYLSLRSSGMQRITGASVQIN
jgi:hypothetical protein